MTTRMTPKLKGMAMSPGGRNRMKCAEVAEQSQPTESRLVRRPHTNAGATPPGKLESFR